MVAAVRYCQMMCVSADTPYYHPIIAADFTVEELIRAIYWFYWMTLPEHPEQKLLHLHVRNIF